MVVGVNTGGRYNPNTNSWTATTTTNAPIERYGHTAVWSGTEMIIWGGNNGGSSFKTGGRYLPGTNSWTSYYHDQCAPGSIVSHRRLDRP